MFVEEVGDYVVFFIFSLCVRLVYIYFLNHGITHEESHQGSKYNGFNILYEYQRIQIIYVFFCKFFKLCSLKILSVLSKLSILLSVFKNHIH